MEALISFMLSVLSNFVGYLLCKWFDMVVGRKSDDKNK